MKYRCDMVKDLMPLCLDHAASASSEQTVIEHLAECKECSKYYEAIGEEIEPIEEQKVNETKIEEAKKKNVLHHRANKPTLDAQKCIARYESYKNYVDMFA